MILTPSWFNLFRLQFTVLGYYIVNTVLTFMEMIRLAPKGSGKVRERPRAAQPMHGTSGATHTRPSTACTQAIHSRRMPEHLPACH